MSAKRTHRPPMDRTAPHRDFASILGQAASTSGPDTNPRAERSAPEGDPIANGVRAAYQVIDAYLRQGQRVAQQFGKFAYTPLSTVANTADLQARTLQLWNDLIANWFDLLGVLTEAVARPLTSTAPDQGRAAQTAGAGGDAPPVQLAYEIASRQPACVSAQFHQGRATTELASHGLRNMAGGCIDVAFDRPSDDGPVVVKIRVPDEQEPGLYTGVLLDARNESVVGSVTLQLR